MEWKLVSIFKIALLLLVLSMSTFDILGQSNFGKNPKPGTIFMYPERPLKEGGMHNAELGIMFVEANRSKASIEVISLEIYRFKAQIESDSAKPPIFFLHGGPSFEGLENSLSQTGTLEKQWLPLTEIAGVIVIGQRGIGSSKPTTLIEHTIASQSPNRPLDYSKRVEDFLAQLEKVKRARN